jgi:hypothetical protein
MIICPRCGIEQEVGKEFCGTCGSFLLIDEEPSPQTKNIEVQLICPMCQDLHHKGNYCKKCGSLLMQGTPSRETNLQPLQKKSIKKRSKKWLRLFKEKKALEICLRKLEAQKGKISSDVFDPLSVRYQDRLKELLPLHQEIETELDFVRRKASEEIDLLEQELRTIQKRLEEFRFLYKEAGITKADFLREKHEMNRGIQLRERNLKKCRQILSLLPQKMGGSIVSQGLTETLFRPFPLLIVCGLVILVGTVGFFLWQRQSHSNRVVSKEIIAFPSTPSSSKSARTIFMDQEAERIKSLFETVRQANLQQNIDLFMTCFSRDFTDREKKRLEALKTWDHFNYLSLSYDLKKQMISGETADIRLEWLIRSSEKVGGKLQENRVTLDAILRKENGRWKIQEIKPVS